LPADLKRLLKRRQVVDLMIGHMKSDQLFERNWCKGEIGDALHAVMCGSGHNLRRILACLRAFYCVLVVWLATAARWSSGANPASQHRYGVKTGCSGLTR
jgi:IS5 family transposase